MSISGFLCGKCNTRFADPDVTLIHFMSCNPICYECGGPDIADHECLFVLDEDPLDREAARFDREGWYGETDIM